MISRIILPYADGGSTVLRNIAQVSPLGEETHYFVSDTDQGINKVTVTNVDGFIVRHYNTQKWECIA